MELIPDKLVRCKHTRLHQVRVRSWKALNPPLFLFSCANCPVLVVKRVEMIQGDHGYTFISKRAVIAEELSTLADIVGTYNQEIKQCKQEHGWTREVTDSDEVIAKQMVVRDDI